MPDYDYAIEQVIKAIKDSKLSMCEISRRSGIARSTIFDWLKGNNAPTIYVASQLLHSLGYKLEVVKKESADDV